MESSKNQEIKSKKASFLEMMRNTYPDVNYDDEEDIFGAIEKDINDKDEKIKKNEEEGKKIVDLFTQDPRSAEFFNSWVKGKNPIESLIELFGDEFRDALDDPEQREKFSKSYQSFLEKVAKSKEMDKKADENLLATFELFDKMQKENGWSDEEVQEIFTKINDIYQDGLFCIIKPETITMVAKALNYDSDIEEASRVGEIKGKNAKITEKLKKEDAPSGTPPTLGGDNDSGVQMKAKKKYPYAFAPGGVIER